MPNMLIEEIAPDFWRIEDICNVYIVKRGQHAIAIDFGSGKWLDELDSLGINQLDHVLLTHHHDDQCRGLSTRDSWPFDIHTPVGEDKFLDPEKSGEFHRAPWLESGCPASYSAPRKRIPRIKYDLNGFCEFYWNDKCFRIIHTPGHGPNACSIVIQLDGNQYICCGDAAHDGATIWEPFHLEWDHWTGGGALAAWEGVERLKGIGMDALCPSHGPIIKDEPARMLEELSGKLLDFYRAKGQISPGVVDLDTPSQRHACGARQLSPSLYQFGNNGYLLTSKSGEALVIDPFSPDLEYLYPLCEDLKVKPTACTVSHYHFDHCDGAPVLREKFGVTTWLHPQVAEPWADPSRSILPWLKEASLKPFELLPTRGIWRWNEYEFRVAPWPGQTWWHCVFMTEVDGRKVMFGGDSFQPSAKWNGTGGFCAYNNSRFLNGYIPSAELAIDWNPDIIAAEHGCCYLFSKAKFDAIILWAKNTHNAILSLCPHKDLDQDYYSVYSAVKEDGFRSLL